MSDKCVSSIMLSFLKIYIVLLIFVVPESLTMLILTIFTLFPISIYILFKVLREKTIKFHKWYFIVWILLIFVVIMNCIISEYHVIKLIQNTIQLFALSLLVSVNYQYKNKKKLDIFYIIMTIMLGCYIISAYLNGQSLVFTNFADRNYASMIVLLYFLYSVENKYKIGFVLSIFYLFASNTRLYIISMIFCFIFWVIKKIIIKNTKVSFKFNVKNIFSLICFMIFFTYLFSYFWVNFVVGESTTSYKLSLNDTSNAIRMNSNLYSLITLKNDKKLLYRGYDTDIKNAMGVGSDLLEEHKEYNGMRIVQPHNSFINPFLTYGVIYTILYFVILSYILSKLIDISNLEIWASYFVSSLFMHSLLTTFFLVYFIIVLKSKKCQKIINDV